MVKTYRLGEWMARLRYGAEGFLMRGLHAIIGAIRSVFDLQRIIRWAQIGATVIATAAAVLLASFVAVAMGLI